MISAIILGVQIKSQFKWGHVHIHFMSQTVQSDVDRLNYLRHDHMAADSTRVAVARDGCDLFNFVLNGSTT